MSVPLTLAEAAERLDPPIAVRTLRALVTRAGLQPIGHTAFGPGRPARTYDSADLDRLHAAWVRREITKRRIVTYTFDEVLDRFGITREELDAHQDPWDGPECQMCNGTGRYIYRTGAGPVEARCGACNGHGRDPS